MFKPQQTEKERGVFAAGAINVIREMFILVLFLIIYLSINVGPIGSCKKKRICVRYLDYYRAFCFLLSSFFCLLTFPLLLPLDSDVDLTYEGDNVILLQAMAKALLDEFLGRLGTGKKMRVHF